MSIFLAVKSLAKYVLIAVAIVVLYAIIAPSSLGGWVLYVVVAALVAGALEVAFRRFVA